MTKVCLTLTFLVRSAIGPLRLLKRNLQHPAMNFGGYRLMSSKAIRRNQLIYATDHLYGICQQELLKVLAWQVTSDRGAVDIGKNYKYLFQYLPAEQEKEFSALLDLSSLEKISQSLFATMKLFRSRSSNSGPKDGI